MARLGYHNVSIATLAPAGVLLLPRDFTAATPSPPLSHLLYATTIIPENQYQIFVPKPSQLDRYHRSGTLSTRNFLYQSSNFTFFYSYN